MQAGRIELRAQDEADPLDVDSADHAIEVVVMWGDSSVLHVEHMSPPRSFRVGEMLDERGKPATDFLIGRESLGMERVPVLIVEDGVAFVVLPEGASGEITLGDRPIGFAELEAQGTLLPCGELAGAW